MTPLQTAPAAQDGVSKQKLIFIIIGLVAGLCLLVAIFVGGIIGIVFYSIGHSQAAETAKTFLRQNGRLKQDIGEVKDFGAFVQGNINAQNGDGNALLSLKVLGARQTVSATVQLVYRHGNKWIVTGAEYRDEAGRKVVLLNPYDPGGNANAQMEQDRVPPPHESIQPVSDDLFAADVLQADVPVLVEFIVTYSVEGRKLAPTFDAVCAQYTPRVKCVQMNTEDEPNTYQRYDIVAIPTLILFNHGREQARIVGATNPAELAQLLDKHLGNKHPGTK